LNDDHSEDHFSLFYRYLHDRQLPVRPAAQAAGEQQVFGPWTITATQDPDGKFVKMMEIKYTRRAK
jgi:hypothetical protein